MKVAQSLRNTGLLQGIALLGLCSSMPAQAALLTSFENTTDGWTISAGENPDYAFAGFSTTDGVTDQTYSAIITGTAAPTYGQLLVGPESLSMTNLLSTAQSVTIDVTTDSGFGFGTQWSAVINNGELGYTSLDGFSYSGFVGPSSFGTLSWDISAAQRAILAASPNVSNLIFQVGGGDPGTMYVDRISTVDAVVPEPGTLVLASLIGTGGLCVRRRYASPLT